MSACAMPLDVLHRSADERAREWGFVPLHLAVLCGDCNTISAAEKGAACPRCAAPAANLHRVEEMLAREGADELQGIADLGIAGLEAQP